MYSLDPLAATGKEGRGPTYKGGRKGEEAYF